MKVHSIETGLFKLDGGAMFGVVPKTIWQKLVAADNNNLCTWSMRSLLVEDSGKLVLIDNGIGDKQDEKFFSHYFLHGDDSLEKSLNKLGYSSDDITDVILTHLHFDHCGGSVIKQDGKLKTAFKNATYWSNEKHWKWATEPNAREKASFLKENILPIQESGQLKFISLPEKDYSGKLGEAMFSENITVRFVNGHTEAMMLPQIKFRDKTIVFVTDLLPARAHIPLPYVMAYDMFPLTTLQEKRSFLHEAVANDYILFFQHDAQHECCVLNITEKGIKAGNTFKLADV